MRTFPTALLEWNGFDPQNKNWVNLKAHFGEAYQLFITSGPAGRKLLPGIIANAQGLVTDQGGEEDGLTIITNALGEVTMSNNAAAQATGEEMAALNREMASMRAGFAVNTQGAVCSGVTVPTVPTIYDTPPPMPPASLHAFPQAQAPPY